MSASHGDPGRGDFSDRELDVMLSAANEELLGYVRANANPRATLLRIMEIRDDDGHRPARRNGAGKPIMLPHRPARRDSAERPIVMPQPDREPSRLGLLRRRDLERIGLFVVLGAWARGRWARRTLGRSVAGRVVVAQDDQGVSWPRRPGSGTGSPRR